MHKCDKWTIGFWVIGAAVFILVITSRAMRPSRYSMLSGKVAFDGKQIDESLQNTTPKNYIQDRCFYVARFHFNAEGNDNYNLNDEYVSFINRCSYSLDMTGWTVRDENSYHTYT